MTLNRFSKGNTLRGLALAGAALLPTLAPTAVAAEDVNLISSDGTINIVGEFVDFTENSYVIRTALGELRLSAARVRCEGAACPVIETTKAGLQFAGSDTVGLGIMPLLLEGYGGFLDAEVTATATGKENELLASMVGDGGFGDELGSYLVSSSGSSDAFRALLEKSAEIGMASRRITPNEARALRDSGAGNMVSPENEHIVAIDSIVVVTHPDNPVKRLTMVELAGIYSGQITNWSQVGGPDLPIKVIDRSSDSGTHAVFASNVLGDSDAPAAPNALVADDNNEVARLVNEDPAAIGYTGYAFQRGTKALTLVNECGLAMVPDAFSARTEEYALQRRLYLYNRADAASDQAKDFLSYAMSKDADEVVLKSGFIDLGVESRPQPLDGDRARQLLDPAADAYEGGLMREMLGTMVDYDRLSTTFRFRTGASKLDERAVIDMARLVEYLENKPENAKLMFVGFTDDIGAFDSNRTLSVARAEQVMTELQAFAGDKLAGVEMAAIGFGEIAPSACNSSDTGRAINRRVEVWIQSAG
ncbi:phosphate ABC transporter substrate-binding/OmpA family protein [Jannaschia pohangensis]|uniref:Phosphate ABC transporter substrate-binding protein, PhoT family n=1 Tax=Jannaschia pohangensis TaxID=390807 RepID=A0A1I3V1C8_9RHOB|nr:phosphate ABC transporter substrate-binding/OmpA family protein [Jannaschia pohangensis]SFJ88932.1 phosphate ABC transporter substrate-binding protein, PhoT family [Jannaschia pohangensis]